MNISLKILIRSMVSVSLLVLLQCKKTEVVYIPDPYVFKLATSPTLGSYLTDKNWNALYIFASDADGASNCITGCIADWTVFDAKGLSQLNLVTGLILSDFDSITSANGRQLTYKGWPLYYYSPGGVREKAKLTSGDNVGPGLWFVAKPDYTVMVANFQLVGIDGKSYIGSATNVYTEGSGESTYFTDARGRTLYVFASDSANVNLWTSATDTIHNAMFPVYNSEIAFVPSALDKTLFGSLNLYGTKQLTYKGWPVYYFGEDVDSLSRKFRGNTKGISVGITGTSALWPALFKDVTPAPAKK